MKNPIPAAVPLSLVGACSAPEGNAFEQSGSNPSLPAIDQYVMPPMRIAPVASLAGAKPTAMPGLEVDLFANGFANARSVLTLPNGDVLVVESRSPSDPVLRPKTIVKTIIKSVGSPGVAGANRITLLRDVNADGKPDYRGVFLDGLDAPYGIAVIGDDLFVANATAIIRYPYSAGQVRIDAPGTVLTELPGGPVLHHWTRSLVASPDGSKLYVGIGSASNVAENGMAMEQDRARIWEIDRATGAHRDYATGLRNPNGLTFEPRTGKLWTVVNERDELGPDVPPDYLTSVRDGGFYGWPYSYWGRNVDPRVMPRRPDLVARAVRPDYSLSGHVAPLGLVFAHPGTLLPGLASGAFISEHGSWNRRHLNGYKVVFVPFADGRPAGRPIDVVTGFVDVNGDARGRPVGLAFDRTGALLVADDVGNAVWRVSRR